MQHTQNHEQPAAVFVTFPPSQAISPARRADPDPPSRIPDGLVLFTDGSRRVSGSGGAGVVYQDKNDDWHGRMFALGNVLESHHAEMHAVLEALKMAREIQQLDRHRRFLLYTDSKDVVNQLGFLGPPYGLGVPIHAEIRAILQGGATVEVHWVKGHHVCLGNELADELAGEGSRRSLILGTPAPQHRMMVINDPIMKGKADRAASIIEEARRRVLAQYQEKHLQSRDGFRQALLDNARARREGAGGRELPPGQGREGQDTREPPSQARREGLPHEEPGASDGGDVE